MELKLSTTHLRAFFVPSFNRTFMELKLFIYVKKYRRRKLLIAPLWN